MRNQKKNQKECTLYAVCNGECAPLSTVPDEVFSSGMLGQGVAFTPADGAFVSPVSGTVVAVAETAHAYSLCTPDGVDVLVHIGVDTVSLGGEGMTALVKEGDTVKVGTPLAQVNLSRLKEKDISSVTSLIVTANEELNSPTFSYGTVKAGDTWVMKLFLSEEGKR